MEPKFCFQKLRRLPIPERLQIAAQNKGIQSVRKVARSELYSYLKGKKNEPFHFVWISEGAQFDYSSPCSKGRSTYFEIHVIVYEGDTFQSTE